MIEYVLIFIGSLFLWLPIYYYMVSRWVGDHVVKRVENKEIDLNYLLDEGGVFDSMAGRTVELLKNHMLAEMGQMTRAAQHGDHDGDPASAGIAAAGELLKAVGIKKPPAILQFKLANAMGQMLNNSAAAEPDIMATFDPSDEFYKQ